MMKNPLNCELFMLFRQGILLSKRHIGRSVHMLIMWEIFGTELFQHLRPENVLHGGVLNGFHFI